MTDYEAKKRALGIAPTNIDAGFPPEFGSSKYAESDYLPGQTRGRRKVRAPALPPNDLSHLNDPEFRKMQRIGRLGGRARK